MTGGWPCPECGGAGWVIGSGSDTECCNGSEWECGGRGCTGPIQVQVQIQEQCEYCRGSGFVEADNEEAPPLPDPPEQVKT